MQKWAFASIAAALALAGGGLWNRRALNHDARPVNRSGTFNHAPGKTVRGSLSGKVLTSGGEPIAHARVCATCATCDPTVTEFHSCALSDSTGAFSLGNLLPMAYRLAAAAKGFSPGLAQEGKAVRVVPDANGAFDVVLAPGGAALAGAATDAAGRAIPDAEIRLVHWQPPWMAIGVRANSVGRYEQWVSEGAWTVSGIAEGYACSGVPAVAPSEDASVVLAPGGILKGVVESEADRQRVAGVEVTAKLLAPNRSYVLSTVTTDDGSFVLSSLEGGSYLVRAAGRGLRGEIPFVSVAPRQQPSVSIPVRSAARVRGRVLIGSQSTPCEEGSVTLGAPGPDVLLREGSALPASPDGAKPGQTWGPQTSTQIDSQGNALFESVAPGHYFATVECRDHVLASGPDVIDVSERDVQGLVWRVEPGVGVDVQVVDELTRPVAGAEAWLEGPVESGVASK